MLLLNWYLLCAFEWLAYLNLRFEIEIRYFVDNILDILDKEILGLLFDTNLNCLKFTYLSLIE
jgi:hypothetical protein